MRFVNIITLISLFSSSLLVAVGCEDASEFKTISVEHYKSPCQGVGPQFCLLTREQGAPEYLLFYGGLEGFTYQWGHRYELEVRVTEISNPPADGSSRKYELVEVLSDEVVTEPFVLNLSTDFISGDPSTGSFTMLYEREVTCASSDVCLTIDERLAAGSDVEVEFLHPTNPADPLIANAAR